MSEARRRGVEGLAVSVWLGLALTLLRSAILVALEITHHGHLELAWLRLTHTFVPVALAAVGIGVVAELGRRSVLLLFDGASARAARVVHGLFFATLAFQFLCGRMGADVSRRIGVDTDLGLAALGLTGLVSLLLFAAFVPLLASRWGLARVGNWPGALAPLVALVCLAVYLRAEHGGLGATMRMRSALSELYGETPEVLAAREDRPPRAEWLCPSRDGEEPAVGRPSLVLAPPARVRYRLPEREEPTWLRAAIGIDHSATELAERHPGHAVRFTVRVDERPVFEARLPLEGGRPWTEVAGDEGLALRSGATLELETALLDPSGSTVISAEPLAVGFAGLELERRAVVPRARATKDQPNLVLVVVDTLRADRTSAYGYGRATTPNLGALARRGVLFDDVCSTASWTWPATASILTGLWPEQHGVQDAASSFLSGSLDTLAEALQRAGFTTGAWSGSPLIVPDKNFDQGFEFFDASKEGRLRRSSLVVPPALEWLDEVRDQRFFLYLHLMEPHAPYVPLPEGAALFAPEVPATFASRKTVDYAWDLRSKGFTADGQSVAERVVSREEQRWISDLYDACVWSADRWLGDLEARLAELGLDDRTLVVVTSDHGEELFDHGLLGHGQGLHRELVRVPLVMAGPGLPSGQRVSALRSTHALAPTLARLVGASLAGLADPADLLRETTGGPVLFSTRQGWWNGVDGLWLQGLREGSAIVHYAPLGRPWGAAGDAEPAPGEIHFYDLATDAEERTDLAPREPERAQTLCAELQRLLSELGRGRARIEGVADEATLEMLRGLGYAGR